MQTSPGLYQQLAVGKSHIVIVLDCSGSMASPYDPDTPRAKQKTRASTRRLDALQSTLLKLPAGVTVSLYTYGAKEDGGAGEAGGDQAKPSGLRTPGRQNREEVKARIQKLRRLSPYYFTPLLRTMKQAGEELRKEPDDVTKALVVLTDGADTTFRAEHSHMARKGSDDSRLPRGEFRGQEDRSLRDRLSSRIRQGEREQEKEDHAAFKKGIDEIKGQVLRCAGQSRFGRRPRKGVGSCRCVSGLPR